MNSCFEYWLGHKAIHAALQSLNLKGVELVGGQTADEGLWVVCWGILRKELPDLHSGLDAVADGHGIVHDNKLVIVSILLETSLHELEGFVSIASQVRRQLVLLQHRHDRDHVVRVVIYDQDTSVRVLLSTTLIEQVH